MISYKHMKQALKGYPKLIRDAVKDKHYDIAEKLHTEYWTLKWILEANDDD